MVKKYLLYLLRWQLSTPLLAASVAMFIGLGTITATIFANFIGGIVFFWVDYYIFRGKNNG